MLKARERTPLALTTTPRIQLAGSVKATGNPLHRGVRVFFCGAAASRAEVQNTRPRQDFAALLSPMLHKCNISRFILDFFIFGQHWDKNDWLEIGEKIIDSSYHVSGPALSWLEWYLTNRQQRVVVNGKCSEWCQTTSGTPEGGVISALCFAVC